RPGSRTLYGLTAMKKRNAAARSIPSAIAEPQGMPQGMVRGLVLGGSALFLLLGTVLTGYCFTITLLSKPEQTTLPTGGGETEQDWRQTLREVREQVTTPAQLLGQGGGETTAPAAPSPKVAQAIDRGVAYLKRTLANPTSNRYAQLTGATALAGLALL